MYPRPGEAAPGLAPAGENPAEIGEEKHVGTSEGDEQVPSCNIEVNECEDQRICRICQLGGQEIGKIGNDLIELGCGCKGELGVAHPHCAESWFRVKGNRSCEICGEIATSVVLENRAVEIMISADLGSNLSSSSRRFFNDKLLCWLLTLCLTIAFVLPWFVHMNVLSV